MNIIITGASRGIGYETVKTFAKNGKHTIFAIARNLDKLTKLVNDCKKESSNSAIIPFAVDLSDENEIKTVVDKIKSHVNSIDILINNAGYLINKSFNDTLPCDFDQTFNINVKAPFYLTQQLLPFLKNAQTAHVINVSSMGGFQGSSKFPGLSAYSASKSAIAGLTECLAEEYKESNIKFNALALGAVATEMLAEAFPEYQAPTSAVQMAEFFYEFALNGHKMFNGKILPVSISTP